MGTTCVPTGCGANVVVMCCGGGSGNGGGTGGDSLYRGVFATSAALVAAHPTDVAGAYATVTATGTIWLWNTTTQAWEDSGTTGPFVESVNGKIGPNVVLNAGDVGAATADHTHAVATQAANGFMSAADKAKLDNMASGGGTANQNAFSHVKVGSTTIDATSETDTLELAAGANVSLAVAGKKVTISATGGGGGSGMGTLPAGAVIYAGWEGDKYTENGNDYLRCNGQTVLANDYPLLMNLKGIMSEPETALTPTMTANNAPAPYVVTGTPSCDTVYPAYKAFDKGAGASSNGIDGTYIAGSAPRILTLDCGLDSSRWINFGSMSIKAITYAYWELTPKVFDIEASIDGSSWILLGNYSDPATWEKGELRYIPIGSNGVSYRYIRIVDHSSLTSITTIGEWELYAPNVSEILILPTISGLGAMHAYIKATNN